MKLLKMEKRMQTIPLDDALSIRGSLVTPAPMTSSVLRIATAGI